MAKRKSNIAKDILSRVRGLYAVFLLIGVLIIGKVIWLQYGPEADELKAKSEKISFEQMALPAERGDILARDGRTLMTSVPTYDLRMDFEADGLDSATFYNNIDSLSLCLSGFFGDKPSAEYKKMFVREYEREKKNRYRMISPRRVSYLELKEISEFPLFRLGPNRGGVMAILHNKRERTHGSLGMRTIGFYINDSVKCGIEGSYINQLKGTDGMTTMQRISGSFKVPVPDPMNLEPINGMDVVSTLDIELQDVAEKALKEQLQKQKALWGTVILMEVATGEIHAMANITRKGDNKFLEDYNYAIGASMEPGSTFKLATLLALLEDGKMSLDHKIDCEQGRAMVGPTERTKRLVRDTHRDGVVSLRRVFEVSSNIGISKATVEVYGKEQRRFVDFLATLGLDKTLDVGIDGERKPLLRRPGQRGWDGTSLVMMSQGYALQITPLHTLALYNAVANDGKLMRPQLVKEVKSYGKTVYKFENEAINPAICSQKTVREAQECLRGVVDEGTARLLKNDHYTVAAKTGTAQVALSNGRYMDQYGGREYLGTMVGYFPADNPKYSCIVAIKTYHRPGYSTTYYGSPLAGPVFKAISDRVYASNPTWHQRVENSGMETPPSEIHAKSGMSSSLEGVAKGLNIPILAADIQSEWSYVGRGEEVVDGWMEQMTQRESQTAQQRSANSDEQEQLMEMRESLTKIHNIKSVSLDVGIVPSVVGMGLKDAIYLLEKQGLRVSFSGMGEVVSQSIEPGVEVEEGTQIVLRLGEGKFSAR